MIVWRLKRNMFSIWRCHHMSENNAKEKRVQFFHWSWKLNAVRFCSACRDERMLRGFPYTRNDRTSMNLWLGKTVQRFFTWSRTARMFSKMLSFHAFHQGWSLPAQWRHGTGPSLDGRPGPSMQLETLTNVVNATAGRPSSKCNDNGVPFQQQGQVHADTLTCAWYDIYIYMYKYMYTMHTYGVYIFIYTYLCWHDYSSC